MHTFFVEDGALSVEDARHAFRVLRLKPGDDVVALSCGARWQARISDITEKGGAVELVSRLPDTEPPIEITVYQGMPKAEKMEFLAQKLTELGVVRIVPVRMERSVAKMDGDKRLDRLTKIAREAVKQCGRGKPPEILPPMDWKEAVSHMRQRELMLAPWENAESVRLRDVYRNNPAARDIGVLIGPEGGMTEGEIASSAAKSVTLGPRILRAETAAVTSAALVMSLWGDI